MSAAALRRSNDRAMVAIKLKAEDQPFVARLVRGTGAPSETTVRVRRVGVAASELVRLRDVEAARLVGSAAAEIAATVARETATTKDER